MAAATATAAPITRGSVKAVATAPIAPAAINTGNPQHNAGSSNPAATSAIGVRRGPGCVDMVVLLVDRPSSIKPSSIKRSGW